MAEEYRPVWQTWSIVSHEPTRQQGGGAGQSVVPHPTDENVRRSIQLARVDRRVSIPSLAAQVNLDPSTLASFECGEEVLPDETVRKIQTCLGMLRK